MGIPLPGQPIDSLLKGVDTGGSLFSRIMNPILSREQMAQRQKQFEEEMALRRAQFARSGANSDVQRAILEQQLQHLRNSNDPMYEFNQFKAMQDMLGGGQGGGMQQPIPTDMMGQGMGVFSPEGLQSAQDMASMQQPQQNEQGINLDALRQNPLLRGFFKHKFGYDPFSLPQTPEDKEASQIKTFREKERIKAENKGNLTNPVKTLNQNMVNMIPQVQRKIRQIIDAPSPSRLPFYRKDAQAAHVSLINEAVDTLIKAKGWPNTNESLQRGLEILERHDYESDDSYRNRLRGLLHELDTDRLSAQNILQHGVNVDSSKNAGFSSTGNMINESDPLGLR